MSAPVLVLAKGISMPNKLVVAVAIVLVLASSALPEGGQEGETEPPRPVLARAGWHDEPMPAGIEKAEQTGVYHWQSEALGSAEIKIEMVYVQPGAFLMGSESGEANERPSYSHAIPNGYYIGRYEITWRQYRGFCRATARSLPLSLGAVHSAKPEHPVGGVTWADAEAFCAWAGLCLPSEAQWEKAARGTDGRKYPWGDDSPGVTNGNFLGGADGYEWSAPVGAYVDGVSPCGAYDMAGNVWEWCADWYNERAYSRYSRGDYVTSSPDAFPSHVLRGGSWSHGSWVARAAYRGWKAQSLSDISSGFRPVAKAK